MMMQTKWDEKRRWDMQLPKKEDRKNSDRMQCREESRSQTRININFPLCSFSRQKEKPVVLDVQPVSGLRTLLHGREKAGVEEVVGLRW
jgi:hypothetical protein